LEAPWLEADLGFPQLVSTVRVHNGHVNSVELDSDGEAGLANATAATVFDELWNRRPNDQLGYFEVWLASGADSVGQSSDGDGFDLEGARRAGQPSASCLTSNGNSGVGNNNNVFTPEKCGAVLCGSRTASALLNLE
jgi:hypothetical protein